MMSMVTSYTKLQCYIPFTQMYRNTSPTLLHPHILSQKWEPCLFTYRRVCSYSRLFLSRTQAQGKNLEFESEMNSIKDKVSMRDPHKHVKVGR